MASVLSKEHRNTYMSYNAEMANQLIRKLTISNDPTEFDDQLTVFRQYCSYILNTPNSENVKREDFFTNNFVKRLHIKPRN